MTYALDTDAKKITLFLEDGTSFEGFVFGKASNASGEVGTVISLNIKPLVFFSKWILCDCYLLFAALVC